MKKILINTAALFSIAVSSSNAGWWRAELSKWNKIEQTSAYIRITNSDAMLVEVAQADASGSFGASVVHNPKKDEIHITPPSGKEKEWLSLILTAAATGGKLQISAIENGSVLQVPSTGTIAILP